jgi:hypothetical protein
MSESETPNLLGPTHKGAALLGVSESGARISALLAQHLAETLPSTKNIANPLPKPSVHAPEPPPFVANRSMLPSVDSSNASMSQVAAADVSPPCAPAPAVTAESKCL